MPSRRRAAVTVRVAVGAALAFLLLTLVVVLGLLDALDVAVRDWARPDFVWDTGQQRAWFVIDAMSPPVAGVFLVVFTAAVTLARHTRDAVHAGVQTLLFGALASVLTVGLKIVIARPDPAGGLQPNGGAYPSGHTTGVLICSGLALLLVRPHARWWAWLLPAGLTCLMGVSLVVEAAHWVSDVVGAGLLSTAVLAVAVTVRRRAPVPIRPDPVSPEPTPVVDPIH